ncbi:MAG: ABC transporter ATP-binding protein [Bacteroidetes bacterium]|nr:ABC transporter ATP-binding protein [Bacteroidota bacterium]
MLKVQNINKSYADVKALKDISFNVSKGELFGFIGPDGAGKTTLLRIITTLLLADDGSAKVNGYDVVKDYLKIRKIVGYMPGKFSLYQDLTVLENLEFFATVFGTSIDENYDLIKDIYSQIEPFKHRRAGKLSGGMKQKLALSCALIHKPKVLILDEPTTGVDAVSRMEFWDMLKNIQKKDISILVSTPYMDEASLCDRVALIQKGELMSIDTPQNIIKLFNKNLLAVRADNMYKLLLDLRNFEHTDSVFLFGQYLHLTMKNNLSDKKLLNNYLANKKYSNIEIFDIEPNIEDCFMDLMGGVKN